MLYSWKLALAFISSFKRLCYKKIRAWPSIILSHKKESSFLVKKGQIIPARRVKPVYLSISCRDHPWSGMEV